MIIYAVSDAVILKTLSYQEAWEMVNLQPRTFFLMPYFP